MSGIDRHAKVPQSLIGWRDFFIGEVVGGTAEDGRASPCGSVNRKLKGVDIIEKLKLYGNRKISFASKTLRKDICLESQYSG